ncbi:hypothetical protein [Nocardia cyriacigeorgica]|uniref:hypothetical protein n=1 Tax=Nocardia cyriacigeorgica TaxID=135487 RepID=UPI0018942014|nr:hypothetical protein [Nocardia cyriacigeorgica]MBF6454709.1 hypothetical protein [Nocardia cyriacigeorgica]MBF6480212.1 hypothetical protein [Nocardia cyriacigeorgica]MBF6552603.1 hypothetical protein [Nocardia cyriacigeorgica]
MATAILALTLAGCSMTERDRAPDGGGLYSGEDIENPCALADFVPPWAPVPNADYGSPKPEKRDNGVRLVLECRLDFESADSPRVVSTAGIRLEADIFRNRTNAQSWYLTLKSVNDKSDNGETVKAIPGLGTQAQAAALAKPGIRGLSATYDYEIVVLDDNLTVEYTLHANSDAVGLDEIQRASIDQVRRVLDRLKS